MTTKDIIENITSRSTYKVREASCQIIHLGQEYEKIKPFIQYLPLIKFKTIDLNMGGAFAPNQRFIDFAIRTIEFHKSNKQCSCALYVEKYRLTNDIIERDILYDGFNPNSESKKGYIKILETICGEGRWIDYYLVECSRCKSTYKVEEREGHFKWWNWIII